MGTIEGWAEAINQTKISWIDNYFPKTENARILDLGAGAGWYSKYLADKGCSVTSIDISPLFEDRRINIKTADLEDDLEFDDEEFDLVMAWDIIEHVSNHRQLLSEIFRVSRPRARILVSVPHSDDSRISSSYLTYCHFKDKTHKREYTPESLKLDFENSAFTPLVIKLIGGATYPYVLLNFIDNRVFKLLMKIQLKLMMMTKVVDAKGCHGDIFGAFVK